MVTGGGQTLSLLEFLLGWIWTQGKMRIQGEILEFGAWETGCMMVPLTDGGEADWEIESRDLVFEIWIFISLGEFNIHDWI